MLPLPFNDCCWNVFQSDGIIIAGSSQNLQYIYSSALFPFHACILPDQTNMNRGQNCSRRFEIEQNEFIHPQVRTFEPWPLETRNY